MYNFASVYIVLIVKKIMKTLVIIPSRLSAQRLPGKPLMKMFLKVNNQKFGYRLQIEFTCKNRYYFIVLEN